MSESENPKVNRYLKDKAMDLIDHALGRPLFPLEKSYRNHFATEADGDLAKQFDASPFWRRSGRSDDMAFYSVTHEGREALAAHLKEVDPHKPYIVEFEGFSSIAPAKSRSAARYAYYLRVSDACHDLSFSDFQRRATVRSAPLSTNGGPNAKA
ncbi:hypothetical protein GCM10011491_30310 [Brucella endophytica]|uniref:Uncharacterized protein n=1 Tax=Brucella endophytica TaxID=1963359 RepID=A0A916WHE5_9HYPH|nr:hypothetical protein [Brucella endophytica]GGB00004.1 hypothetical protein GCM10011491_30310 [Brucella endophytica]